MSEELYVEMHLLINNLVLVMEGYGYKPTHFIHQADMIEISRDRNQLCTIINKRIQNVKPLVFVDDRHPYDIMIVEFDIHGSNVFDTKAIFSFHGENEKETIIIKDLTRLCESIRIYY